MGKATVLKFDGNAWVTVGQPGFSADLAATVDLAISPSNQPYVSYRDWGNAYKATVMMFNGTSWTNVGPIGFSQGSAFGTSIKFHSNGEIYVAYRDHAVSQKQTVMKFATNTGAKDLNNEKTPIKVFPNPSTGFINFSEAANIELVNIAGQLIENHINVSNLDISDLPKGVYFVTFTNNIGSTFQRTMVVKE